MTFDAFVQKYSGRYIDWDGYYGAQCVDLMRFYQRDVLGVPPQAIPAAGTAKDIYNNFRDNQYFTKIANTPNGMPVKGDIIFWGYYPWVTGWAGHVAIYSAGDLYTVISFDQNYPTGSACHIQKHGTSKLWHGYLGVLGWLHKK